MGRDEKRGEKPAPGEDFRAERGRKSRHADGSNQENIRATAQRINNMEKEMISQNGQRWDLYSPVLEKE